MERLGSRMWGVAAAQRLLYPLLLQVGLLKDCFGDFGQTVGRSQEPCQVPNKALLEQMNAMGRHARYPRPFRERA